MAAQFSLDSPDTDSELWEVILFGVFLLGVGVGVKAVLVGQRLVVWWKGPTPPWTPAEGLYPPGWHSPVGLTGLAKPSGLARLPRDWPRW